MTEHRHVTVTADEFPDIDAALAWVVQTLDAEFATADMPKITIEQVHVPAAEDADWAKVWCASIAGSFPVGERTEVGM